MRRRQGGELAKWMTSVNSLVVDPHGSIDGFVGWCIEVARKCRLSGSGGGSVHHLGFIGGLIGHQSQLSSDDKGCLESEIATAGPGGG